MPASNVFPSPPRDKLIAQEWGDFPNGMHPGVHMGFPDVEFDDMGLDDEHEEDEDDFDEDAQAEEEAMWEAEVRCPVVLCMPMMCGLLICMWPVPRNASCLLRLPLGCCVDRVPLAWC